MSDFETFEVLRWYDPELIPHNTTQVLSKYGHSLDLETLTIPPEAKPIIFVCRLLTRQQRRMVRSQPGDSNQFDMAFRFGVMQIKDLPTETGPRTVTPARAQPYEPITDDTMDQLGLSEDDEQEIGMVIRTKSFLGRGVPLSCPQLDSSLHAYSVVAVRHAEQKRASETQQDDASES